MDSKFDDSSAKEYDDIISAKQSYGAGSPKQPYEDIVASISKVKHNQDSKSHTSHGDAKEILKDLAAANSVKEIEAEKVVPVDSNEITALDQAQTDSNVVHDITAKKDEPVKSEQTVQSLWSQLESQRHNNTPFGDYEPGLPTVITGLWDIGRDNRPMDSYLDWMNLTMQINAPFIIYIDPKYYHFVKQARNPNFPTLIINCSKEELPYYQYFNTMETMLKSEEYQTKMEDSDRVECRFAMYNIIMGSKFDLLADAVAMNPFISSQFLWIDAGASRFFNGFDPTLKWTSSGIRENKFYIQIFSSRVGIFNLTSGDGELEDPDFFTKTLYHSKSSLQGI